MKRRPIAAAFIVASFLLLLLHDFQATGFAADRLKRIHELETREAQLYERLAEKDAQRESQRRIYIDRIRKAQVRENVVETTAVRARSEGTTSRD